MADREIRLIGTFQDDITPKLNRLNRQLLGTLKQFEKLQSKIAPVANEMAKFNTAAAATSGSLKSQRSAIEENIRMLRQYRTELSKTSVAQSRMGAMRPPRGGGGGRPPVGGGGATPSPIPRGRPGGGGGGGGIGAGVFGVTLGTQIGNVMTNAIVAGFQTGTQIMMAPFRFGAQAIGERIRDEMSDVRTAGGLFAISKRMKTPIFSTFPEAEAYTKDQNRYLAKLAGALPGDTQEYIQVSKQISDGIFTVVAQDRANAQKLAKQLALTRGASAQEIAKLSGTGTTAMQQTGKELVGEMTKLTVLAGLGGRQGAYGLPQLTERMIAEQQVSMGMFQRYAAIFRDPMIKGALERNIANINATGKNTAARLEALRKTFAEIVTPELVRRYQRTTAGVLEALRTAFLNPEVGLLGLGRPLGKAVTRFDEFGRAVGEVGGKMVPLVNTFEKNGQLYGYQIDKAGRVFGTAVKAATEQISIFDNLRDMFANIMIVLQPVIDNIALIFDPLAKLGGVLSGFRDATMKFQSSFEVYREFLVKEAKKITNEAKRAEFLGTVPLRASLQAINNAMRAYGGYGKNMDAARKEFDRVSAILADPKTSISQMSVELRGMIEKFLSSDFAKKIGSALGTIVGTIVAQVGEIMKAASGLATGSKLAQGFGEGFRAAGGPEGIAAIIKSVFHIFGKLLLEIIKAAPLESAIAAALFFLPGAIAGLISEALTGGFRGGLGGGGRGGRGGRGGGSAFLGSRTARGMSRFGIGARTALAPVGPVTKTMMGMHPGRAMIRQRGMVGGAMRGAAKVGKYVPGGALAFGAVDAGLRIAEGQNAGQAIGGAAASVIGSTLGGILGQALIPIPGVGAAIGGVAGGFIGDAIFNKLSTPATTQEQAAQMQLQAAQKQMAAVDEKLAGAGIEAMGPSAAAVADPMKLAATLRMMGLYRDPTAQKYMTETQRVRMLVDQTSSAATALNAKIAELKGKGYRPQDIAKQADYRGLQARFNELKTKTANASTALQKTFDAMPQHMSRGIQTAMTKINTKTIEYAIANKINMMETPKFNMNFNQTTIPSGFTFPTATPTTPQVDINNPFTWGNLPGAKPKRAFGGPVSANRMYKVGERGPELFVAGSSGTVVPNNALGGTTVTVGTINVNGSNAREIADEVANELLSAMYRKSRSEVLTS